ncbi:hypothetical protein FNO01nite_31880 [Flavobacterium noncentrifugens]|uniref:DUF1574 domain-containing protein n=1 Tax=Flavobacterium noncentrifugens TaxID=1128970 RepID=A0A1G9D3A1_9FLAO|nr:hypothetical protein [Flavobacterium noncentrifugens]GEP52516.1 hypothetical protein FNO01nite_31880 [Flavobacterium noncentrifugens]SDK58174.1 hypothetical protein SAMN04487935_3697 [Flavobacterium noncentrifugens]
MKKFLRTLLFFAIPVIFAGVAFEILLRRIPNDYSYKSNFLDKNAKKIEVLFLGNSHVYYGIDPKFIESKSFNASNISQPLDYDLKILEKYQNDWKHLKYVVVPVDYFSLFTRLESGIEAWRVKNYDLYFGMYSNCDPANYFEIVANQTKYNLERLRKYYLHGESDLRIDSLGWGTANHSQNSQDLIESGMVSAKRHRSSSEKRFLKGQINVLQKMADFCKERNIKLILFSSPAYKTYVENLDINQMNKNKQILNTFAASDKTVQYYDLLTDCRFDSVDFYDADHLNEIGAKKLSGIFDSIIKSEPKN